LIIVCGIAASFALYFLAVCAKKTTVPSSFYKVASLAIPKYSFIIDLIIATKCFGVATSYLVVVGDLVPLAISHLYPDTVDTMGAAPSTHRNKWIIIGFLIVAPLSCLRSLDALRYTSGISGAFLFFLIILVVGYAMPDTTGLDPCHYEDATVATISGTSVSDCHGERAFFLLSPSALHVMPIFVFSYACQQNSFGIVNELRNPTIERINLVFVASICTAIVIYIIMASAGYLAYGNTVKPNILVSYPNTNLISIARISISLVVAFHYPLQAHPARKCMMTLMHHVLDGENAPEPTECSTYYRRYAFCMTVFLVLSLIIALSVKDLGIMLSLVGATGSTCSDYPIL
jgi:amino acid permease